MDLYDDKSMSLDNQYTVEEGYMRLHVCLADTAL